MAGQKLNHNLFRCQRENASLIDTIEIQYSTAIYSGLKEVSWPEIIISVKVASKYNAFV